jgi:hypothetical protein
MSHAVGVRLTVPANGNCKGNINVFPTNNSEVTDQRYPKIAYSMMSCIQRNSSPIERRETIWGSSTAARQQGKPI